MPQVDMPLNELQTYQGISPRPADFDEFWERALAEMHETDSNIEIVPSRFQTPGAECFDLYFTGVRDARIHVKYARPRHSDNPHPAVVKFHGYSGNAGDWHDLLGFITLGYSVLAMDCRGQGGYSQEAAASRGIHYTGI